MSMKRLVASLSVSVLVACSSDVIVAPSTPDGFLAVHFDEQLGQACKNPNDASRCGFLALFAVPPAFGAAPSAITIDTGTGPLHWQAFVLDIADSSAQGQVTDSITLLVFSDTNVAAGLVIDPSAAIFLSDSNTTTAAGSSEFGNTVGDSLGACARPPTLRHTSVPSLSAGTTCTVRAFNVFAMDTFLGSLTVTMAPQNVNGVRILQLTP